MTISRRHLLAGSAAVTALYATPVKAAAAPQGLDAAQFGVRVNAPDDQTLNLQRAIDISAKAQAPLWLAGGHYRSGPLTLRPGSQLFGVRGLTRIALTRGASLLSARGADGITLAGLTLDGGDLPLAANGGLVHLLAARNLRVTDCALVNAGGNAAGLLQCEGEVAGNTMTNSADNALYCVDSKLVIRGNTIAKSGNGGIRVWQSVKRHDGSLVEGNTIEDTGARDGGDGPNGNAINVYKAADVIVRGNMIARAAFTAVRGNAASNIQIVGNHCSDLAEVAIYSEFDFEGAVIANNVVDRAAVGVSVTNFNNGGRLAVVQGNLIRNLVNKRPQGGPDYAGVGIGIEADSAVTGNTIENAPTMGIEIGYGEFMRNVSVTGNVVRIAGIGIGVSVARGAGVAAISGNVIAGATRGAIVGMEWDKAVTGDLAQGGAERYPNLRVSGNQVS
jgi:uncharacterized secreted repeat protein (TIGR03808 family)